MINGISRHLLSTTPRPSGSRTHPPTAPIDRVELSAMRSSGHRQLPLRSLTRPTRETSTSVPAAPAAVPRTLLMEAPQAPIVTLLPVPDTRQSTTYSCGAAALQAVLMYWGIEYVERDLMDRLHTDPQNGTNPRDIVRVAREEGLQAELREGVTIEELDNSVKAGCPVIIDCQAWRDGDDLNRPWRDVWDSGHYMVVIGVDDKNVYFEDPSMLGSRGFISREDFMERWHDVDEKKYVQGAIFIQGKQPAPPPPMLHVD